jgi:hypothetical protein
MGPKHVVQKIFARCKTAKNYNVEISIVRTNAFITASKDTTEEPKL